MYFALKIRTGCINMAYYELSIVGDNNMYRDRLTVSTKAQVMRTTSLESSLLLWNHP